MPFSPDVTVVGGGLAGCEAAFQLARRGLRVSLVEMKPGAMSPAHGTPLLAELVCSNSLRSDDAATPAGLLKAELKRCNVSYRDLADKLAALGIHETERNIANKISRGGFTAAFFAPL